MIYKVWVDQLYDYRNYCIGNVTYYEEFDFIDIDSYHFNELVDKGFFLCYEYSDRVSREIYGSNAFVVDLTRTYTKSFNTINEFKKIIVSLLRTERLNNILN
jgi:hypothetical protein